MGAAFFQTPELVLAPAEAKALADATAAVAAHYDALIDPKTAAWLNLVLVAGGIYGTRAMAVWGRKKQTEARRGPSPVAEFPQPKKQTAAGGAAARPATPADMFGLGDYSFVVSNEGE